MSTVYATETAAVAMPDGSMVAIRAGQPFPADHPVVARCRGWFSDTPPFDDAPVETATAVPGERRAGRRG